MQPASLAGKVDFLTSLDYHLSLTSIFGKMMGKGNPEHVDQAVYPGMSKTLLLQQLPAMTWFEWIAPVK